MLMTKYLVDDRSYLEKYEELAVLASINQLHLEKLMMEVKFYIKKVFFIKDSI